MRSYTGSVIIAVAMIISVFIAAAAYRYRFISSETITVTGLAEKDFISDQIVWKSTFSRTGTDLKTAYTSLKSDEAEIKNYLNGSAIADSNIVFSAVDVRRNYDSQEDNTGKVISNVFTGYTLTGSVTVDSKNITNVEKLSREITGLLQKGIELNSTPPSYYYSRLNELKIDLLAKAAADAKQRAHTIAENSGTSLGGIKKASMGVFQITGKNENEQYSYGGALNTSAKIKTASITLKVDYQVR